MLGINDKYKKALEYHGYENQKLKYNEELNEFDLVILTAELCKDPAIHITNEEILGIESEAADLINMIKQRVLYFGGDPDNVDNICITKMQREEKRINKAVATGEYTKD